MTSRDCVGDPGVNSAAELAQWKLQASHIGLPVSSIWITKITHVLSCINSGTHRLTCVFERQVMMNTSDAISRWTGKYRTLAVLTEHLASDISPPPGYFAP